MDILMRAGEEISGKLVDWTDENTRPFWRGRKPTQAVDRIYFVRDGSILGWAYFSTYEFIETKTVQGQMQSGDAFVVKGPFNPLTKQIPRKFLRGQWRWRYISDELRKDLNLG